jgi:hypothetical protein
VLDRVSDAALHPQWTAALFTAAFALTTVLHLVQAGYSRRRFLFWTLCAGSALEMGGWAARLTSATSITWVSMYGGVWDSNGQAFLAQIVMLIIAPGSRTLGATRPVSSRPDSKRTLLASLQRRWPLPHPRRNHPPPRPALLQTRAQDLRLDLLCWRLPQPLDPGGRRRHRCDCSHRRHGRPGRIVSRARHPHDFRHPLTNTFLRS